MPTTLNEAQIIVKIIREYLDAKSAAELSHRLNEEVGKTTENDSVKVTMQMLEDLFQEQLT